MGSDIQKTIHDLDRQINELRIKRNQLQSEDDDLFLKKARKNIGRCFRNGNTYVKVIDVPQRMEVRYGKDLNRYQYPAVYVHADYNLSRNDKNPFTCCSFFSGYWGEGSAYDADAYTEITPEEFDKKFVDVIERLKKHITSIN